MTRVELVKMGESYSKRAKSQDLIEVCISNFDQMAMQFQLYYCAKDEDDGVWDLSSDKRAEWLFKSVGRGESEKAGMDIKHKESSKYCIKNFDIQRERKMRELEAATIRAKPHNRELFVQDDGMHVIEMEVIPDLLLSDN
jgi:hypothetical protein